MALQYGSKHEPAPLRRRLVDHRIRTMHTLTPRLNRRQFQWGLAAAAALTLSGCGASNAAPASRFLLLDGSTVTDADLRGQVTLVNFWATTCVTCVQKMPDLVALYQRHRERGFDTIAVAMSHDPPEWVANFARTRQLPFKVALDHNSQTRAVSMP